MTLDMPYFLQNEDWYYFDFKSKKYILTSIAPEKAKQSYFDFYDELNNKNKNTEEVK